jgi:transposase
MKTTHPDVDAPVVDRWHIPDDLWEAIALLLPQHKNTHRFGGGRPRTPDRVCMEAIFFVLRTGCQWKALNATRFCPSSTAHDRFQEWVAAGVFQAMWEAGLMAYDDWKGIDWSWLSLDGCMTKAPLGGEKDREKSHRSRQEGRETQSVGRGHGHPRGLSRRRRQPSRLQAGRRDAEQYTRRATRTHAGEAARAVRG